MAPSRGKSLPPWSSPLSSSSWAFWLSYCLLLLLTDPAFVAAKSRAASKIYSHYSQVPFKSDIGFLKVVASYTDSGPSNTTVSAYGQIAGVLGVRHLANLRAYIVECETEACQTEVHHAMVSGNYTPIATTEAPSPWITVTTPEPPAGPAEPLDYTFTAVTLDMFVMSFADSDAGPDGRRSLLDNGWRTRSSPVVPPHTEIPQIFSDFSHTTTCMIM